MPSTRKRRDSGEVVRADARGRIPEREAWLYENERAIAQVRAGLADASEGRVREIGSSTENTDT